MTHLHQESYQPKAPDNPVEMELIAFNELATDPTAQVMFIGGVATMAVAELVKHAEPINEPETIYG